MATIGEGDLSALLVKNAGLRLIEPHIYSVLPDVDVANPYDTRFGYIYDWIGCNPIYNRIIWGYSVELFARIASEALRSFAQGNVLDLGCGSLAFTAKTYIQYSERPVVLVDQSLKMLRIAKSRLMKINGDLPGNMVFLHADALRLPFQEKSFKTIISENLLHCLSDTRHLITGLKNILSEDGEMFFISMAIWHPFTTAIETSEQMHSQPKPSGKALPSCHGHMELLPGIHEDIQQKLPIPPGSGKNQTGRVVFPLKPYDETCYVFNRGLSRTGDGLPRCLQIYRTKFIQDLKAVGSRNGKGSEGVRHIRILRPLKMGYFITEGHNMTLPRGEPGYEGPALQGHLPGFGRQDQTRRPHIIQATTLQSPFGHMAQVGNKW